MCHLRPFLGLVATWALGSAKNLGADKKAASIRQSDPTLESTMVMLGRARLLFSELETPLRGWGWHQRCLGPLSMVEGERGDLEPRDTDPGNFCDCLMVQAILRGCSCGEVHLDGEHGQEQVCSGRAFR